MSSDDEQDNYEPQSEDISEHIEVVYPLNEPTEVPQTRGQLFKTVLKEGHGSKPPKGSKVHVHYVGTLESDGSKFDSSRDRDELFTFTIGQGQVIKGWDVGVATMRKGEKAILRCLPEYAYGKNGSPPKIPADSTLNFEVELFDWEKTEDISVNKDRSVMKMILQEGKDWNRPDYESELTADVSLLESLDEDAKVIATVDDFHATIGETDLPQGFDEAFKSMKKQETALVEVKNVRSANSLFPQVKIGESAFFRIALKEFTKVTTYSVTGEAKVVEAKKRKESGNEFFKKGLLDKAIAKYKRGVEFIEWVDGLDESVKVEANSLKVSMWSNTAQCYLSLHNYKSCVEYCNKVLGVEPNNAKALFRRGKALGLMQEWDQGAKDLKRLLELEPSNGDAANELNVVLTAQRNYTQQQKARYTKMFA